MGKTATEAGLGFQNAENRKATDSTIIIPALKLWNFTSNMYVFTAS